MNNMSKLWTHIVPIWLCDDNSDVETMYYPVAICLRPVLKSFFIKIYIYYAEIIF